MKLTLVDIVAALTTAFALLADALLQLTMDESFLAMLTPRQVLLLFMIGAAIRGIGKRVEPADSEEPAPSQSEPPAPPESSVSTDPGE